MSSFQAFAVELHHVERPVERSLTVYHARGTVARFSTGKGFTHTMAKEEKQKAPERGGRSKVLYIGSIVILVLVIVTFVGAPAVTGSIGGQANLVFGRYNGQDIAYRPGNYFARQYDTIAQSLRGAADQFQLEFQLRMAWREAFNRAVLHTAVLQRAEDSGIRVSERKIDEMIASDPRFSENGRFSTEAYRRLSNQERFALRGFYRETATFQRFVDDVLGTARASEAERSFFGAMSGPERSFSVVRFGFDEFPLTQVRTFAQENPELFTQLQLAVITVGSQEEANQMRTQAESQSFGDVARTFSRDLYADRGGEIGRVDAHQIQRELVHVSDLERIAALQTGQTSTPVQTTGGWSIYRALENPQPLNAEDEVSLERVRDYMRAFEPGRVQDWVRSEAESFARTAREVGFSAAADQAERAVLQTPFFAINYGNTPYFSRVHSAEMSDLAEAAYREDFFRALFALEADNVGNPIVLSESAIVVQLREERPTQADSAEFLTEYYDAIAQQFNSDHFQAAFVDNSRLQDGFAQAFNRYVLGN